MSSNTWRSFGRIGAAITLGLVLLCCGQRDGMVPGGDSAVPPDVEVPDAYVMVDTGVCEEAFETAGCGTDWSGCAPVEARPLVYLEADGYSGYLHALRSQLGPIERIGVVIRERAALAERWAACYNYNLPHPLPDLPEVDFSSEMVIWYTQSYPSVTYASYPEVWDCGGCLVFVPVFFVWPGEMMSWPLIAVAVPTTDASVQFEDPMELLPGWDD